MSIYWKTSKPVTILRYATLADLLPTKKGSSLRRIFLDNLACVIISPGRNAEEEVCYLKHLRADEGQREIDDALEFCALRLATQYLPRCAPYDSTRWIYHDETTWWCVSREALIRLGRLLARGDLHVKDPLTAWLEDDRLTIERVPLEATTKFQYSAPSEPPSRDLYEECQRVFRTNLPRDIYAACARAFNTTRDDAKERLLVAMYGAPSKVESSPVDSSLAKTLHRSDTAKEHLLAVPPSEDSPFAEALRRFQAAVNLLRGLDERLSLYVASDTLCLMSGPSHDEGYRPLRDNVLESVTGLRISGGDW